MCRPLIRLVLAVAVGWLAVPEAARAQTAKEKSAPVVPHYDPPDQPFRMAPMPQSTRSIVVPLATNLHLAFDTALLRTHTVWSGKGLALLGPQFGLPKSPFISTNDGTVLWTMPPVFPWVVGKLPEKDADKLPEECMGFSFSVAHAVLQLSYQLPNHTLVREYITAANDSSSGVRHAVELGRTQHELWFLAHADMGRVQVLQQSAAVVVMARERDVLAVHLAHTGGGELRTVEVPVDTWMKTITETVAEKGNPRRRVVGIQTRVYVRLPPSPTAKSGFSLSTEVLPVEALGLDPLKHGSNAYRVTPSAVSPLISLWSKRPASWLRLAPTVPARPSQVGTAYYRAEAYPLPKEIELSVCGLDFLPNGDLVVCTWPGEVWIVEQATGPAKDARYRRFARGLCEPMGVVEREGKIYVATKQGLYRLTDTDGNGEADLFECLNQSWGYTGSYNAFVYGPVFDKAGNFILANAGHSGRWDSSYMGWALRLSPDGKQVTPICSGLREPNGIGTFGPDREVFVTENQGQWMAACKLNHVTPGKFYGHPSAWPAKEEEYGKHTRFDPPAVWFPYKLARSVTGFVEITDDRFGPFKGQLMVGDFQNAIVTRVQLEKVNGEYQGAVWPFLKQFQSGVNRLVYGPDGKLYVGGLQAPRSWSAVAPLNASLERIEFTGIMPFEVKEVHALRDGFELTFTQPVEPKAAADPESYDVTQHGYKYHAKYGSPELDHDGKENATTVIKVAAATVSLDKLKVRLQLAGWKPGYVTMVRSLDVKNATGDSLVNDTFWYTLNQVPK